MTSHIPNAPLVTQENRPVRFYDDLIKGRVVLINFMFATCNGACPRTSANLRNVQKALGAHSGRDVFLCSLTLDLEHDTPEVLRDYSKSLGAAPGWTFLTGRPEELELLRRSLGFTDPDPKVDADKTKHSGIAVFGDDARGTLVYDAGCGRSQPDCLGAEALAELSPRCFRGRV